MDCKGLDASAGNGLRIEGSMNKIESLKNYNDLSNFAWWAGNLPDQSPASIVAMCRRGDWLLSLANRAKVPREAIQKACAPFRLRALRVHAAGVLDRAGMRHQAKRLRTLPDGVDFDIASDIAWACRTQAVKVALTAKARQKQNAVWTAADACWSAMDAARHAPETAATHAAYASAAAKSKMKGPAQECDFDELERIANEVRSAIPDLADRFAAILAA